MMSAVPLETCWAFNKLWNNKFYYKAASCWHFYWVIYDARIHEYQNLIMMETYVTSLPVRDLENFRPLDFCCISAFWYSEKKVNKFASSIDDNFKTEKGGFSVLCRGQTKVWKRIETSWKLRRSCGVFVAFTEEEAPKMILGNEDSRSASAKAYNVPCLQGIPTNICEWRQA